MVTKGIHKNLMGSNVKIKEHCKLHINAYSII